jgi:hypothetical protein
MPEPAILVPFRFIVDSLVDFLQVVRGSQRLFLQHPFASGEQSPRGFSERVG